MTPDVPKNSSLNTDKPPSPSVGMARDATSSNQAAIDIVRGQLDDIYSGNSPTSTPQPTASVKYSKTTAMTNASSWEQYHNAWQDYYQKYYERYYMHHVDQARKELTASNQPLGAQTASPAAQTDENVADLRSKLRQSLHLRAKNVRKSRHFMPIVAAFVVMLVFLFLQYNRVLFANVEAYISPGNIDPANIIVDPATSVAVSPDPKLIIPKINVDVPVIYDTTPDYDAQMNAMTKGVAWFGIPGANSRPGQVGNTVLSGHSSNDIIDQGDYKFIFARLDHLELGDTIYVNYQAVRYIYTVTNKEVVKPTDVSKLVYQTDKPVLTLITCTPLGTSLNRLLITAEQVSPSPSGASAAPVKASGTQANSIPGNSPTFLQRIFGN